MIELRPGKEIAGYVLGEPFGAGGMGQVFRAIQINLQRPVALKVIRTDTADTEEARQRFILEARTAAQLEHPNVLPIYEVGQVDGLLFISMRLVEGPSLADVIEKEVFLDAERAVSIVCQVSSALAVAHERGFVHRDVKPANILLATHGSTEHAYLADFGLVRFVAASGLTKSGSQVGTPAYMSPEQIRAEAVDGRADLYALGCVLYQALTGVEPFLREEMHAVYFAHLEADPPYASVENTAVDEAFDQIVRRAMAKDPVNRYPDCVEFAEACRESLVQAMRSTPVVVAAETLATLPPRVLVWGRHSGQPLAHPDLACPRLNGEIIPPAGVPYAGVGTAGWMTGSEAASQAIDRCESCFPGVSASAGADDREIVRRFRSSSH
ncbi:MAG: serine/threonine-protein kinase [Gaiellaceae bacterium]